MKNTERGETRGARLFRFGGAVWFENSVAPTVMASDAGTSTHLAVPGRARSLADGARARPVGDDRPEAVGLGRSLQQQLAADRETYPSKARAVDIRAALQEGYGGLEVPFACPAEGIRIAFALTLSTPVEEALPGGYSGAASLGHAARRPTRSVGFSGWL